MAAEYLFKAHRGLVLQVPGADRLQPGEESDGDHLSGQEISSQLLHLQGLNSPEIKRSLIPTIQGLRGQPQWEGGVPGAGGDHLPGVQDIERDVTGASQSPLSRYCLQTCSKV